MVTSLNTNIHDKIVYKHGTLLNGMFQIWTLNTLTINVFQVPFCSLGKRAHLPEDIDSFFFFFLWLVFAGTHWNDSTADVY